jgi:hypothetical protein
MLILWLTSDIGGRGRYVSNDGYQHLAAAESLAAGECSGPNLRVLTNRWTRGGNGG